MADLKLYRENNKTVLDDGTKARLIDADCVVFDTYVDIIDKTNRAETKRCKFTELQDKTGAVVGTTKDEIIAYLSSNTGFKPAGGGSPAEWGAIGGNIDTQADLVQRLNDKVKTIGKYINANVNQTIYSDGFVTISWDATAKQCTYTIPSTTPLGAWGWHDAGQLKCDGNATQRRGSHGDVSSAAGTFYFFNGGTRNTNFDLENYGARAFYSLTKESFIDGFPSYRVDAQLGNTGAVSMIIHVINPQ